VEELGVSGPLGGLRVVELGGIGPGPHAAMVLADLGADVVRGERPSGGLTVGSPARDVVLRGRRSVAADVKTPEGLALVLDLVEYADVLREWSRPQHGATGLREPDQHRRTRRDPSDTSSATTGGHRHHARVQGRRPS
jgi:crotonobetainyl-CoA:carnitine CoA-transferase CaiB-like acyl-CoA transferase